MNQRQMLALRLRRSRNNLLWVVCFTFINVILALMQANLSFLFTASAPTFFVQLGQFIYEQTASGAALAICLVLAAFAIGLYVVFFLLSKRWPGFLLAALILFGLDTALLVWLMFPDFDINSVLNLVFHGWVIFDLVQGVRAWRALSRLPEMPPAAPTYNPPAADVPPPPEGDGWSLPGLDGK